MEEQTAGNVPEEVYEWLSNRVGLIPKDSMVRGALVDARFAIFQSLTFGAREPVGGLPARLLPIMERLELTNDEACLTLYYDLQIVEALEQGGVPKLEVVFASELNEIMFMGPKVRPLLLKAWWARLCRVIHVCPMLVMALKWDLKGDRGRFMPLPFAPNDETEVQIGEYISMIYPDNIRGELATLSEPVEGIRLLPPSAWPFKVGEDTSWELKSAVNWYAQFRGFTLLRDVESIDVDVPDDIGARYWMGGVNRLCIAPRLSERKQYYKYFITIGVRIMNQVMRDFVYTTDGVLFELVVPVCWPGMTDDEFTLLRLLPLDGNEGAPAFVRHEGVDVIKRLCIIPDTLVR